MNAKQLTAVVRNVTNSLTWAEFIESKSKSNRKQYISELENYAKFKFLQGNDLNNAIQSIKDFDINNVWSSKFWGLKKHESICAVATEMYKNINVLKMKNKNPIL